MIKVFSTEHLRSIFAEENSYESFRNLMFDLANGVEIYDEESDRVVSKGEANDRIRKVVFEILEINEKSTKRDRKRAMKRHKDELFEVIEEVIDMKVETGFRESEFFHNFVEMQNMARGDRNEFWTEQDVVLSVTKIAGDHHDFNLCRVCVVRAA